MTDGRLVVVVAGDVTIDWNVAWMPSPTGRGTTRVAYEPGGAALLVSSHVMDEAERCDDLLLLRDGRVLAAGTVDDVRAETGTDDLGEAFLRLVEGAPR